MKKLCIIILLLIFAFSIFEIAGAQSVEKLKAYINSLEQKLVIAKKSKNQNKITQLKSLLYDARATLKGAKEALAPKPTDTIISDEIKELKNEIVELTKEVSSLNNKISKLEKEPKKGATVSGRAFINWTNDEMEGSSTPNQFNVSRVYLDYKHNLDRDVGIRFTTDVARKTYMTSTTESDTRTHVYLKNAYFSLNNLNLPAGLQTIRIGQSATHWIAFMQKYWKFRYVANTMTDHFKMFSSVDIGLAALGTVGDLFDYHLTFMNGEGYNLAEKNRGKDIGFTIKAIPIKRGKNDQLTVAAGFLAEDVFNDSGNITKKATAMTAYEFSQPKAGIVFVEYAYQNANTKGIGVGGQLEFLPDWVVFGRLDNFKKTGDDYVYTIAGIEYNWGKNVKIALDFQNETKSGADNIKTIALHSRVIW